MKKTIKELLEIDSIVGSLYKKDEKLKQTKFGYAYQRFYDKNIKPELENLKTEISILAINNALEDKTTKEVLMTPDRKEYLYSKEGKIKMIKEEKKLIDDFNDKEIDIIPYVSAHKPLLSEEETELLTGVLI